MCYKLPLTINIPYLLPSHNYARFTIAVATAVATAFKCDARRFGSLKIEHALKQSNYRVTLIYDIAYVGKGEGVLRYDLRLGHEECHDLTGLSTLHFQLFQARCVRSNYFITNLSVGGRSMEAG